MLSGKRNIKVCHFTSVHPVNDTRIFIKECSSLAKAGYETFLVATGCSDHIKNGVRIKGVPAVNGGRIKRFTLTAWRIYQKASAINADIYHFHDPELLPYGLLLKRKGKKVIYDVHEDVPEDILTKDWIPKLLRRLVSVSVKLFENWAAQHMRYIITATPFIRDRFLHLNYNPVNVNNYPILNELFLPRTEWSNKLKVVCYVGTISKERGIFEMIEAVSHSGTTLLLAGEFSPLQQCEVVRKMTGWSNVKKLGMVSREKITKIFSESIAGLVLFHPGPNHTNAQPNKMFEYMSASLPIIASNFTLWKEIVEGNNCGICVDPLNPKEIAKAIQWIIDHPDDAKLMGENGRKAVKEKYNWEIEGKKLLAIYKDLTE